MKILTDSAIERLEKGEVIAIPTDTIYGLAARHDRPEAIKQIFEIKKRALSNPLVLFIKDIHELDFFVNKIPDSGRALMKAFWPGPLTLVFNNKNSSSTIAIRIPDHPLILKLLEKTGPLFVTSANISGTPPLKTTSEIEDSFGKNFPILDGNNPKHGAASTILSLNDTLWQIDMPGPISAEDFFKIRGYRTKNKLTITPLLS